MKKGRIGATRIRPRTLDTIVIVPAARAAAKEFAMVLKNGNPTRWPPELDEQIQKLVHDVAVRHMYLFAHFREYGLDDLVSEGMEAMVRNWHKYDSVKGAISTFVNQIVRIRLLYVHRGLDRRLKRETRVVRERQDRTFAPDFTESMAEAVILWESDPDRPLADWLSDFRIRVQRAVPVPKARRGRKWFSFSQTAAVAALMARMNLSTRGVEMLLRQREELRRALRLRHVPAHWWFVECGKFRPHFERKREKALRQTTL